VNEKASHDIDSPIKSKNGSINGKRGPYNRQIKLKTPEDGRKIIRHTLHIICEKGAQAEYAGKIANLLNTWAKLWELESNQAIEKRIEVIEASIKEKGKQ